MRSAQPEPDAHLARAITRRSGRSLIEWTLLLSLPRLTGQSSPRGRWLLDRPVEPGDDRKDTSPSEKCCNRQWGAVRVEDQPRAKGRTSSHEADHHRRIGGHRGAVCGRGQRPATVDFSKVEIKTTDLGNKTYMLEGQGGNITVAVGSDGIIMVDSQFAPLHDKIKAAIAKISPLPIKYLINTHYHGDHVGGNAGFHKDGATIVAHDNIRVRLAAGTTNGLTGAKSPPVESDALPTDTYLSRQQEGRGRRPRRRDQPCDQRPHRRRQLGLFPRRQRARDSATRSARIYPNSTGATAAASTA